MEEKVLKNSIKTVLIAFGVLAFCLCLGIIFSEIDSDRENKENEQSKC